MLLFSKELLCRTSTNGTNEVDQFVLDGKHTWYESGIIGRYLFSKFARDEIK